MITPASAEVKPEMENSSTVVRATGTPRLRAACAFWPIEKIQLPVDVRSRKNVADDREQEEPEHGHPVAAEVRAR